LLLSGLIGLHLGRFRDAYTEMTGMMLGMTMGMLNGFLLGYAAAGLFSSMFWGNLFGILLGTAMGCYFGRAGGLMGIMDGGMGGVMGGSMGAMLLLMLVWPQFIAWTAVLLAVVYLLGMVGLVTLIEQSAPEQSALHLLLPIFTRFVTRGTSGQARPRVASTRRAPIDDYYTFLGIGPAATGEDIMSAYLNQLSIADEETVERAERAYAVLTDPTRRRVYDARLAASQAAGDCCPPSRARQTPQASSSTATLIAPATTQVLPARRQRPAALPPVSRSSVHSSTKAQTSSGAPGPTLAPSRHSPKQPVPKEPPISWVGGVAAFVIAAMLVILWLSAQSQATRISAAPNPVTDNGSALSPQLIQKLQAEAVAVSMSTDGKQSFDLAVNGTTRGYRPSVIKVKQGLPVHINVSIEGSDPGCGRYVGLKGLGVHTIASPGEIATMDFTPTQSGIFQINCDMQMMDPGYLIVTE